MRFSARQLAFSLVELSIVLVILGLLVGGVLSGQSLIHAAQLRSVTTDVNRLLAATHTFRDKYFYLPGDMPNATQFWGKYSAYCSGQPGTDNANGTCNGNGDGHINYQSGLYDSNFVYEDGWFYDHLYLAGLLNGSYGTKNNAYYGSKLANKAFFLGTSYGDYHQLAGFGYGAGSVYGQVVWGFQLVHAAPILNQLTGATNAEDAWNIDTKMDDGLPGTGKILTIDTGYFDFGAGSPRRCVDTYPFATPTRYLLTINEVSCIITFVAGD